MPDRTSSLTFERDINMYSADCPTSETFRRAGNVSAAARIANQASNRRSYFGRLIDALHESRRRQAARLIRDHRHLIHEEPS